jgi:hypothetical protein
MGRASCDAQSEAAGPVIVYWLYFAATPTFAIMALLTGVLSGGPMDMFCSAGHGSPLSGMTLMYLLMSAFHSAPWLKLISSLQRGTGRA